MELVLFKNQGLIHIIVSNVAWNPDTKMVWASTYFGLSGYDGRNWHNYLTKDSGLASDFINAPKSRRNEVWACTDKGLSMLDYSTNTWVTYRPSKQKGQGEIDDHLAGRQERKARHAHRPRAQLHSEHGFSGGRHLGGNSPGAEPRNSRTSKGDSTLCQGHKLSSNRRHRTQAIPKKAISAPEALNEAYRLPQAVVVFPRTAAGHQRHHHPADLGHGQRG